MKSSDQLDHWTPLDPIENIWKMEVSYLGSAGVCWSIVNDNLKNGKGQKLRGKNSIQRGLVNQNCNFKKRYESWTNLNKHQKPSLPPPHPTNYHSTRIAYCNLYLFGLDFTHTHTHTAKYQTSRLILQPIPEWLGWAWCCPVPAPRKIMRAHVWGVEEWSAGRVGTPQLQ